METKPNTSAFILVNYQNKFVSKFLDPNSRPNHLLYAPTGTGKTATSSFIVNELAKSGPQRILILTAASSLMEQYKTVFGDIVQKMKIVILDRKTVREIETLNQQDSFWVNTLAITSLRMAANEEVNNEILSVGWDLIIIDDIHDFPVGSVRYNLLNSIITKNIAKRILILDIFSYSRSSKSGLFAGFEITRWDLNNINSLEGNNRKVFYKKVEFERTNEEIKFIKQYVSLSKRILKQKLKNRKIQNKIISGAASSSLYFAENSLRNLRNSVIEGNLNNLLITDESGKEFTVEEENLEDNTYNTVEDISALEPEVLLKECDKAFRYLDQIQVDSKFNALQELLDGRRFVESKTWICTTYHATASFLYSSLNEKPENLYLLGKSVSASDYDYVNHFQNKNISGGILISTAQNMKGLELTMIENLILYDMPDTKEWGINLLSRVLFNGTQEDQTKPLNIIVLSDKSGVIPTEKARIRKFLDIYEKLAHAEM